MPSELKPCPFCGGEPTKHIATAMGGNIYIAIVRCERCHIERKIAYSPGTVNKPKNAEATAFRMVGREWNRRANNG